MNELYHTDAHYSTNYFVVKCVYVKAVSKPTASLQSEVKKCWISEPVFPLWHHRPNPDDPGRPWCHPDRCYRFCWLVWHVGSGCCCTFAGAWAALGRPCWRSSIEESEIRSSHLWRLWIFHSPLQRSGQTRYWYRQCRYKKTLWNHRLCPDYSEWETVLQAGWCSAYSVPRG